MIVDIYSSGIISPINMCDKYDKHKLRKLKAWNKEKHIHFYASWINSCNQPSVFHFINFLFPYKKFGKTKTHFNKENPEIIWKDIKWTEWLERYGNDWNILGPLDCLKCLENFQKALVSNFSNSSRNPTLKIQCFSAWHWKRP